MSTDISMQTVTYQVSDRRWHLSREGINYTPNVTLDISKFTSGTHYPNGYIPSGTILGKVTATGLYGPYDNAASDGRETATGILFADVRAIKENGSTATKVGSGQLVRGDVSVAKLPFSSGAGSIDTNGKADLPLIRWEA
ncbi:head decoration protein [Nocardia beijingensis]